MILRFLFFLVFFSNVIIAASQQIETVSFFLAPSISAELLNSKGGYVKDFLEKETGLSIQIKIPKSYDDLVNMFGVQSKCFAMMTGQSYVLANTKFGAMVKLRTIRYGHTTYQGMIITHASSGIKTLKDLAGKSIAYTDELSTSGYLYPKKILEKNNIKSGKQIFLKKHDEVVRQVYERKVDAGAAFYSAADADGTIRDARSRIIEKHPDVEKKVIILVKTDQIPNDPIVFSKDFNPAVANKLCMALFKLSQDEKGKQVLLDLYGTEGFVRASDADYASLRQVMGVLK